jgi:hypothetical protein
MSNSNRCLCNISPQRLHYSTKFNFPFVEVYKAKATCKILNFWHPDFEIEDISTSRFFALQIFFFINVIYEYV